MGSSGQQAAAAGRRGAARRGAARRGAARRAAVRDAAVRECLEAGAAHARGRAEPARLSLTNMKSRGLKSA